MAKEWLKSIRENTGQTQRETAKAVGISKSYYEKIEGGFRSVPVDTAKKISAVLGFDWQKFYEDQQKKPV